MKNRNTQLIAILFVLALALVAVTKAAPGPIQLPPPAPRPEAVESPVVTIHSTGDVTRGKTGSFVLAMNQRAPNKGYFPYYPYVNFSVSGTAISGVDYVALVSPAYVGPEGYGVILVKTLPDPRGSFSRQAYSVVVTLEPGLGYTLGPSGAATSAKITIKP